MDRLYSLWLIGIKNLGTKRITGLLEYYKTPKAIYEEENIDNIIAIEGIPKNVAKSIIEDKNLDFAKNTLDYTLSNNMNLVSIDEDTYPQVLKLIENPPVALFYKGRNLFNQDKDYVSIVGSRRPSAYGEKVAHQCAECVARNNGVVVSGLALGIDARAHSSALDAGGESIAVLGCGLDYIYPMKNKKLYEKLEKSDMIISELIPSVAPMASNFPPRNRIISGLSRATVIVEAEIKSGSLITATYAAEQGREVYAVPGNITSILSSGTNRLINDGACILLSPTDIIKDSNKKVIQYEMDINSTDSVKLDLSEYERDVYEALIKGYNSIDSLAIHLDMKVPELSTIITIMEIKNIIKVEMGKIHLLT